MRKMFKLFTLIMLLMAFFLPAAYSEVPHLINYQGRLMDASGSPLSGSYNIIFRIYDAETTGTLLWQGTYANVPLTKGIFSILLGDMNDTGYNFANLAFDKPYWLEIKVGTDEPMTPRQRIASVGYAINSASAEKIKADSSDPSPGFLADKIDNSTIKVDYSTHKIYANIHGSQLFTSSGTFTAPSGITKVFITGCGGGGGGGGGSNYGNNISGGGGGAGAYVIKYLYTVVAGNTYTVTINGGGSGGAQNQNGTDGGTSVFDTLTLSGGHGGECGINGGSGGNAIANNFNGSGVNGGGYSAGSGSGANSVDNYRGGGGGGGPFGNGGNGNFGDVGSPGTGFGSGGAGGSNAGAKAGGNGVPGFILVEW